uniref:Uncharacterized protein n=1 Tax=Arundo donax TaxID=35708 RepID=A0A0A9DV17_ARUDO
MLSRYVTTQAFKRFSVFNPISLTPNFYIVSATWIYVA